MTLSDEAAPATLIGTAGPSEAGPVDEAAALGLLPPPEVPLPRWRDLNAASAPLMPG